MGDEGRVNLEHVQPVFHDFTHDLVMIHRTGNLGIGQEPKSQPPPGLPVDFRIGFQSEISDVCGGLKRRFETQHRELLLHPVAALPDPFEILLSPRSTEFILSTDAASYLVGEKSGSEEILIDGET